MVVVAVVILGVVVVVWGLGVVVCGFVGTEVVTAAGVVVTEECKEVVTEVVCRGVSSSAEDELCGAVEEMSWLSPATVDRVL